MPEPLSPAAQAVLNAALLAYNDEHLYTLSMKRHASMIAAAALRAAADQLLPVCSTQTDRGMQRMAIRNDLLVIAEELEAQ